MTYSLAFQNLVNDEFKKAEAFYTNQDHTEANPYYIGKGNPNADILIIGKELAIDPIENTEAIVKESVNNTRQWKAIIENGESIGEFDPRCPYGFYLPPSSGATWNQYQRLNNLIFPENHSTEKSTFFDKFFLTEINTAPSLNSPGRQALALTAMSERIDTIRNNAFFQQFPIVIVAAGGYWHIDQIKKAFGEELQHDDRSLPQNKFIVFTHPEKKKLVISTRQLSTSVTGVLVEKIVGEIDEFRSFII
ncbi:hypothetical protein [Anditalea andensis]|uniref:Uracil-DNA glycosylase-like domain-containing protein n=1 Tax=Anditalea andensis TaxID=1048983 RepID=A0A074KVR2_9BACT|nr:hypothetical protein [Anditalea andensis]KEO71663.1 hypothetical protein EL17_23425 [Anditalea andensis]